MLRTARSSWIGPVDITSSSMAWHGGEVHPWEELSWEPHLAHHISIFAKFIEMITQILVGNHLEGFRFPKTNK